ncbi:MAG TPA: histidine phosphatase family protein [Alphaproteobacteria bacterium]|nr:histidine phosphatase family protein [Micavibrio sp.]MBK9561858.1 histidine phosphatase family protein [Micavibrio sp.]HQX27583.1 histidine phosphatase family protein [Alphaproteobacteria bacterium]
MKRLMILRHAQTAPAGEGGDRERKLTPQGLEDARMLGETMKAKNYVPDFILCSPVTRTRQTLDQIAATLGKIQTEFQKVIYEGGYEEILSLVRSVDDSCMALLVVGHNPAIHQFAASMAREDHDLMNSLSSGYAPATLTVLDVPRASWADLQPGENSIIDLIET